MKKYTSIGIKMGAFVLIVLVASLIVFVRKPKTKFYNINVDGHTYVFHINPKLSENVRCSDPELIQIKTYQAKRIIFIFNGNNEKDNALFSVMGQNIVLRLKPYFEYQGIWKAFNASEINSYVPKKGDLAIKLIGPRTGSNGTYVELNNSTVIISGNTTEGAQMAADKYVLSVFGLY